jgi:hypothetical protein
VVGPEGNLWFSEGEANKIGEINPVTHATADFPTSAKDSESIQLAVGPEGNIWFPEFEASRVGEIGTGAPAASILAPIVAGGGQAGIPQVCEGARWSDFAFQQPLSDLFSFDGFRWLLNGGAIVGGSTQSFTPPPGDIGDAISCQETVTYPLTDSTAVATSAPVTVISQNSGPTGATGASGPAGGTGPSASNGANGATGPQGPAGQVELVMCKSTVTGKGKHKKTVQKCTTEMKSSPVKFTTAGAAIAAVLSRGKVIYATGSAVASRGTSELLMTPRRRIVRGTYTLTLGPGIKRQRESIAID